MTRDDKAPTRVSSSVGGPRLAGVSPGSLSSSRGASCLRWAEAAAKRSLVWSSTEKGETRVGDRGRACYPDTVNWLGAATTKQRGGQGMLRACTLEATWASIEPLFPEAGLTRVGLVTGLDCIAIPTAIAVRPNARSLSVSQGKGLTETQARVSAAMESLELFLAEDVRLPLRRATLFDVVREGRVLDLQRQSFAFQKPYPELRTLWVEGHELLSNRALWVPLGLVHMDLTLPLLEGSAVFPPCSNGLASGNSPAEALLHGLCEVIERDAYTRFFQESDVDKQARRVDLASVTDSLCTRLVDQFISAGMLLEIWDITSDIGVPAFLCAVLEAEDNPFRTVGIAYGSGAHLNPALALVRALTEAAQARLTRLTGSRDDMMPESLQHLRAGARGPEQRNVFSPRPGSRSMPSDPLYDGDCFEDDARFVLERLRQVDLRQVVAIDLSRPGWPIAAVRVLVPGLEGIIQAPAYRPGTRARVDLP